ncbi:hypothetical protein AB4Z14_13705 [Terrabacter sp. 2TAF16]|uniref:hypothetical protein n=1 Tax=Terrabacter sp. 2TAF16 TaxID=3233008 RepID=UPI003F96A9C9
MENGYKTVRNWCLEHPLVDYLAAGILTIGAWQASVRLSPAWDLLGGMAFADRMSLYTDLMTATGIFLGFSATGLAAYLALSGTSIERFREVANGKVLRQWVAALAGSGLALLVFVVCKVVDRADSAAYAHWLATGAFVFMVARGVRMLYVFVQLSGIATLAPFSRRKSEKANHLRSAS